MQKVNKNIEGVWKRRKSILVIGRGIRITHLRELRIERIVSIIWGSLELFESKGWKIFEITVRS